MSNKDKKNEKLFQLFNLNNPHFIRQISKARRRSGQTPEKIPKFSAPSPDGKDLSYNHKESWKTIKTVSKFREMEKVFEKPGVHKESFTWSTRIPKPGPSAVAISSGTYKTERLSNCELIFTLVPAGEDSGAGINVEIRKTNPEPIRALVNVCHVQTGNKKIERFHSWTDCCKIESFISDDVYEQGSSYDIFFEILWLGRPSTIAEPSKLNLCNSLEQFVNNSKFSDVIIRVGNVDIKAHKVILAANTRYFDVALTTPMKESQEGIIDITDFEIDTMKIVIKFLYTGNDDDLDDVDTALNVLAAAEKYELLKLKHTCEYKLAQNIMFDNVLGILEEADSHNAKDLEKECMKFMVDNKSILKSTPQLKKLCLSKPLLMYEFLMNII
uniref:BTB domain-containing protein n=1 Tax=Bracon brevicornis TaxID=1563983 RepID=A0A6V7IGX8_9HYME